VYVQDEPTASVAGATGQSFVCAKSPALVPAIPTVEIVSGAVPAFCSDAVCDELVVPTSWLANVRLVGVSVTTGAVPLPLSVTLCGLPVALSVTVTLAVRLPVAAGEKVTEMVQPALAASVDGHVFVCVKSPAFVPVTPMLEMVSEPVPVFVRVVVCATVVVPTCCEPNARLVGLSVTAGAVAVPVPVSATVCGLPAALSLT
jgi:hypothetical protein